ncbi:MAG: hypothetical protein CVU56_18425 [Deltaproteobacteria bacterium HGW-Deltaproteobacteria-14]|jgi:hypothetical protein|nr:MAG: hypothetical protein CVU56_18425 [Deltaproteobacteria bacterium HGW-Deltaproteobacteria-14]
MGTRAWTAAALAAVTLIGACGDKQVAPTPAPPEERAVAYASAREDLERARVALGERWAAAAADPVARAAVLREARVTVWRGVTDELIPRWLGTPWTFNGHTVTPGEGSIACGYFVTTVVRHAGFDVDRVALAQAASEKIILTLADPAETWRFSDRASEEVVAEVRAAGGDGLYAVGLDRHAALLVIDGDRADLCHSSVLNERDVTCEDAAEAGGFVSRYRVIGKLLGARMLVPWLEGRHIDSVL